MKATMTDHTDATRAAFTNMRMNQNFQNVWERKREKFLAHAQSKSTMGMPVR